jgi:drug/metabolite transporter (DMT)-like permease
VFLALNNIAYFYAISRIQVAAAILLQYLAPVLVAVFSMLFWKERTTALKVGALGLAVGGCYLVVGGYSLQLLQMNRDGVLAGLAGAVCFAGYTLLGERTMHRYPPWTALLYALAFATISWHILHSPFHYAAAGFSLAQWGGIAYIAVMGTVVPFGLYLVGVNHIRATRAIITATLEPISAGFMSFALLGEVLEAFQILGGGLVIAAIALLQLQREQDSLAPAAIRGESGP